MKFPSQQERPWRDRRPDGFHAARKPKGDPRIEARRLRAAQRQATHVCGPTCKRNRMAK